jgi:hypothetical protein
MLKQVIIMTAYKEHRCSTREENCSKERHCYAVKALSLQKTFLFSY